MAGAEEAEGEVAGSTAPLASAALISSSAAKMAVLFPEFAGLLVMPGAKLLFAPAAPPAGGAAPAGGGRVELGLPTG
jgi:hypothetical protein